MTDRERFIAIVDNDKLSKADAIILLEGDGFSRIDSAAELFMQGWAPYIVISGGIRNEGYGSFPAKDILKKILEKGISADRIILDESSQNTREQALEIIGLAKKNKWTTILLVASHYHQYRAYLTFLKALSEKDFKINIINSPARFLSWFEKTPWGRRIELLDIEFRKIEEYSQKGHISTFLEAIEYQKWKEQI